MRTLTAILIVAALTAAPGCTQPAESALPANRDAASSKADGYGDEIIHGSYTLSGEPAVGDLLRLELMEAEASELPASFEGRYSLSERREDGEHSSSGFYNTYRYGRRLWIRFQDEVTGEPGTSHEKYSWVYWNDTLVMLPVGGDTELFLELPLAGTKVSCEATEILDDNIFEEGLSVEEYPEVSIEQSERRGTISVGVGASSYDTEDGDEIELEISAGIATATVMRAGGDRIIVKGPTRGAGSGSVVVIEDGDRTQVATIACKGETSAPPPRNITCTLARLEGVDGPAAEVSATVANEEDALAYPDAGLDVFDAHYNFDISIWDDSLQVLLSEHNHVQDEVGSFGCDLEGVEPGTRFCEEPIETDKFLGSDEDGEEYIHAMDFWCEMDE